MLKQKDTKEPGFEEIKERSSLEKNLENSGNNNGNNDDINAPLRKMSSMSFLLKKSWKIYKENFWKFIGLELVPILGLAPLAVILILGAFLARVLDSPFKLPLAIVWGISMLASFVFLVFLLVISYISLYLLVKKFSQKPSFKELFFDSKKYIGSFLGVNFLTGIIVFLGVLLFIIPGIWWGILYSVSVWAVIYEEKSVRGALKRSKALVKGHWWEVFIRYVMVFFFYFLLSFVVGIVFSQNMKDLKDGLNTVFNLLFQPFIIIYSALIYLNLREIKEREIKERGENLI